MIRSFQVSDVFLIQSLGRQSTKLNTIQDLLQPYSAVGAALTAVLPWDKVKVASYVLNQRQHNLARSGFLQAQKRLGRPEADILLLAPALDNPRGHPAIWEKLLSHYIHEATQQNIVRIYVDVPDQPLPVSSFTHVGFKVYTRQTVWRLTANNAPAFPNELSPQIRPMKRGDEWELRRLYDRVTPKVVRQAEGQQIQEFVKPPILDWWQSFVRTSFVLADQNQIRGCIRIGYGQRGVWLQLWADTTKPCSDDLHQLVRYALTEVRKHGIRKPIYLGVRDYHGALGTVLGDYGFAPFTDRAKMVKHLVQWVKVTKPTLTPVLENVPEVVAAPYVATTPLDMLIPQRISSESNESGELPVGLFAEQRATHCADGRF